MIFAFPLGTIQSKRTVHQGQKLTGDGEAQTETFHLFRIGKASKLPEYPLLFLFRDARTGIADGNGQLIMDSGQFL